MNNKKCVYCDERIDVWKYRNALYCTDNCRVKAYIFNTKKRSRKLLKDIESVNKKGDDT